MDVKTKLQDLKNELKKTPSIQINTWELTTKTPAKASANAKEMGVTQKTLSFYEKISEFELDWEMTNPPDPEILGKVNILSLAKVIEDWKGIVYFDHTELDDPIRNFCPLDFFVDEACVGIYIDDNADNSLYLYYFEDEPFRLDLDIDGYIELLVSARGFLYWQKAIKAIKTKQKNTEQERFKKYMPQLFPGFSYAEFANKYESLRLSNA